MNRILAGLAAAFLLIAGLVVSTPPTASAACPYTNCVNTQTTSSGVRIDRNTVNFNVRVRAASNTAPKGRVTFTITRFGTRQVVKSQIRRVGQISTNTSGIAFTTDNLRRGTYTIRFSYTPDATSVFNGSGSARKLSIR